MSQFIGFRYKARQLTYALGTATTEGIRSRKTKISNAVLEKNVDINVIRLNVNYEAWKFIRVIINVKGKTHYGVVRLVVSSLTVMCQLFVKVVWDALILNVLG